MFRGEQGTLFCVLIMLFIQCIWNRLNIAEEDIEENELIFLGHYETMYIYV